MASQEEVTQALDAAQKALDAYKVGGIPLKPVVAEGEAAKGNAERAAHRASLREEAALLRKRQEAQPPPGPGGVMTAAKNWMVNLGAGLLAKGDLQHLEGLISRIPTDISNAPQGETYLGELSRVNKDMVAVMERVKKYSPLYRQMGGDYASRAESAIRSAETMREQANKTLKTLWEIQNAPENKENTPPKA